MKKDRIHFRQSHNDFPLDVSLGERVPAWELSRWRGDSGLRFAPVDDEGFALRGDSRQVLYKGQKRSHRFTILGDGAFEYDVILLCEPASNVIALRMEGAERFDFLRQPDFVRDDFLKGSYAVYKKETLVGEGTGKLCHIHRPKIIDARGLWCWGELLVVGNELRIVIPESFLSEAKYPVVVDPTVGTTTVGSQTLWDYDPPEPPIQLYFEGQIPVNRFLVPETINGLCTAYMYSQVDNYGEAGGRPVLYSDNGNKPLSRKSMNENFADFTVNGSKKAGWHSATFNSNGSIASGSYVWFGVFAEYYWEPRFDWGSRCYKDWHDGDIPNTYPLSNYYEDFKLSMYFTYTSAQNYVRTLTQGVKLTDTRKRTSVFKRNLTQNVIVQHVNSPYYSVLYIRHVNDTSVLYETTQRTAEYIKNLETKADMQDEKSHIADYQRVNDDEVQADGLVLRSLTLFVKIITGVFIRDYIIHRFLKAREELKLKSCISREITLDSKMS